YSLVARDGTIKHGEFSGAPIWRESKIVGMVSVIRDITRRKLAEDALSESEGKYRELVKHAPAGIYEVNYETGRFISVNDVMCEYTGYTKNELLNTNFYNLITDKSQKLMGERIEKLFAGEKIPQSVEYCIRTKGGEEIWVIVNARYIYEGGRLKGGTGIIYNITERRRAEEEKVKLEAQYHQSQKMDAIGQLAGGIAHDFNNILNIILGYSQLALMKIEKSSPLHADIQEIISAGKRSTDLIRQLLAFARKQTIAPKLLDLNDAVAGMLNMLRKLIGEDIDLLWIPAPNLLPVKMDPSQVNQIIVNLTINARDSISGVGKITIETEKAVFDKAYCAQHAGFVPGHYIMLAVSDNGCGMDKDTLEKIFEPFFTTKELGKGTGLGLATVYGIVKQNNGFINVYSDPGKGTTFKSYIPMHEKEEMTIDEPHMHTEILTGTETVMLVEDDKALLKMSKIMLEELGYTVLTAVTPGEAIRLAGEHAGEIHLMLTDVIMPEMSGRDLQKRLSAIKPNIKYLFMSGYPANVIAYHGVLDEGVHFLQKPFQIKTMATKVREALDTP
ncbi:MAG: PAS domain S-box protein, partial [Desulfobacteraceae bacterium]